MASELQVAGIQPVSFPVPDSSLFFDLETVPDYSRADLFGLDTPDVPDQTAIEHLPNASETLDWTVADFSEFVWERNPEMAWLSTVEELEGQTDKPRKGIRDTIINWYKKLNSIHDQQRADHKLMSICPEMCQVVAVGWAVEAELPVGWVSGIEGNEAFLLTKLWELIDEAECLIGFNILAFDLKVLAARSCILGIDPLCTINTRRDGDVIDLFARRFGGRMPNARHPGSMKQLAKLYGWKADAEDVDGSMVEVMYHEDPEKVRHYVKSDVALTRVMFDCWNGYF